MGKKEEPSYRKGNKNELEDSPIKKINKKAFEDPPYMTKLPTLTTNNSFLNDQIRAKSSRPNIPIPSLTTSLPSLTTSKIQLPKDVINGNRRRKIVPLRRTVE